MNNYKEQIKKVSEAKKTICSICNYEKLGYCEEWSCQVMENYNELVTAYCQDCCICSNYDDVDFYINLNECNIGDTAYMYLHDKNYHEHTKVKGLEIIKIIFQSDDYDFYNNNLDNGDCLLEGEEEFGANASAEFIYDDDCCLVWFKYRD